MVDDKELFFVMAEHVPEDFWCASERLCNDKEFMMQVVGKDPTLLREASQVLQHTSTSCSWRLVVAMMPLKTVTPRRRAVTW
jgi:Domain of unknown function (DUF4116)